MATIDPFNRGEDIFREVTLTIDGVAADTAGLSGVMTIQRKALGFSIVF